MELIRMEQFGTKTNGATPATNFGFLVKDLDGFWLSVEFPLMNPLASFCMQYGLSPMRRVKTMQDNSARQ